MKITRLHSSRMRTARALTISPSMLCTGGCPLPGGVCSGGVCSWRGLSAPGGCVSSGGVCSWGMSAPGGVCSWGCVCSQGGCLPPGGVHGLGCTWSGTPPAVDRHTPVNILPCPKVRLQAVIIWTPRRGTRPLMVSTTYRKASAIGVCIMIHVMLMFRFDWLHLYNEDRSYLIIRHVSGGYKGVPPSSPPPHYGPKCS